MDFLATKLFILVIPVILSALNVDITQVIAFSVMLAGDGTVFLAIIHVQLELIVT